MNAGHGKGLAPITGSRARITTTITAPAWARIGDLRLHGQEKWHALRGMSTVTQRVSSRAGPDDLTEEFPRVNENDRLGCKFLRGGGISRGQIVADGGNWIGAQRRA